MDVDVRKLREITGMTQKAFGEYFKIPKRTIEDWEYKKRKCNDYTFDLMCYKLVNEGIINKNDLE